ncbi:MAG: type I DNA topoisomerase [Pseudomonadota bacterium]|nr:type I DNA topoisomerase [Pseudomonadota bacterium]
MKVVIVESPAKAKTINKYLGKGYDVYASFGHVRDLEAKDGSVDPDNDFAMRWEVDAKAAKRLADIGSAVKNADRVILATDPDREGEAISWHIHEILKKKKLLGDTPIERVVFNAVTKEAVQAAMRNPREIDQALVDAYLARRALDYLVGFNLSPVLWRKLPGSRSAGRVQSVALRIVCDRELEIEKFVAREYWSLVAHLQTPAHAAFTARLVGADGRKIGRLDVGSGDEARAFEAALAHARFSVASVEAKPVKRHPQPPFTTSTLQQEASRKYGLAPARTMQIAQRLYEGIDIGEGPVGLITYMRTDGVDLAPEAITDTRRVIGKDFGDAYVPAAPRKYQAKAKNAQEAHEAIRPTDVARAPDAVGRFLTPDQRRLYELVWKRAVASQMASAELDQVMVEVTDRKGVTLRATGSIVAFDGFLKLYREDQDDAAEDEEGRMLPPMAERDPLKRGDVTANQHFTQPPPRYSEASLVKKMEELGIGRPSTYASILTVLQDRNYVRLDKRRFIPEDRGRLVTAFLVSFFEHYVETGFTAGMEEKLDDIAEGTADWRAVMHDFWDAFSKAVEQTRDLKISDVIAALDQDLGPHFFPAREDGSDPRVCAACGTGRLGLKLGRYGSFIGCSNYPACQYTRRLAVEIGGEGGETLKEGMRTLGVHPETGDAITVRRGPYGVYVQQGEASEDKKAPKPRRTSLPRGVDGDQITLDQAVALLGLPRVVGLDPETKQPIEAGIGRFGPYVRMGAVYGSLDRDDDVLAIGLNRAVDLLAKKLASVRSLGAHPKDGAPITVRKGRFGPYVQHGNLVANLPRGVTLDEIALAEAVALLAEKGKALKPRGAAGKKAAAGAKRASGAGAKRAVKGAAASVEATSGPAPRKKAAAPKRAAAKPAAKAAGKAAGKATAKPPAKRKTTAARKTGGARARTAAD